MNCGIHKGHETKGSQRRLSAFGWHDSAEFTVDTIGIVMGGIVHARMELLFLDLIVILSE